MGQKKVCIYVHCIGTCLRLSPFNPVSCKFFANTLVLLQDNLDGRVTLKNLMFNYPTRPDVPVLNDLTVEINPGQTVALVGASGCGKSTVISLLERFYDVANGVIVSSHFSFEICSSLLLNIHKLITPSSLHRLLMNEVSF